MNINVEEYYYIRNAQSDIIGLFDKTGAKVVSYTYDSWGKLISIDGSLKDTVGVKNPYRYRGYRYDSETGLYYLNSRYYNPEWGRFINADYTDELNQDTSNLIGNNLFTYCNNEPINKMDSDGRNPIALAYFIPGVQEIALGIKVSVIAGYGIYKASKWVANRISKARTNKVSRAESKQFKKPKVKVSGKEGAKDAPSWAKGQRPYVGESGNDFAKRLLDQKYGKGNYDKGAKSE